MKPVSYLLPISLLVLAGCGADEAKLDAYVADGQAALRSGDWKVAQSNLSKAVRLRPGDGRLQYNLGQALLHSGRFSGASKAFSLAAETLDGDEAVDALLGLARARAEARQWAKASDALLRARDYASDQRLPDILAAQSGLEFRQRHGESARSLAAQALDLRPDHPVALYNLGCVFLYHFGDRPAARRAFVRYMESLKTNADVEASRRMDPHLSAIAGVKEGPAATTAERLRECARAATPDAALNCARVALREDPLDATVWRTYAEACSRVGKFDEARRAYRRLVLLDPSPAVLSSIPAEYGLAAAAAHLRSAAIAFAGANYPAAITHYQLALESNPESFEAASGLEKSYRMRKDYASALEAALRAHALRPDDPDLLFTIGCYLAGSNDERTSQAVSYYRRYLQRCDPASPKAEQVRAWLRGYELSSGVQ